MKYEKVVVGGTFDFLHDGHKAILSKAFEVGEGVLIGIVSDHVSFEKNSSDVMSLENRLEMLEGFLKKRGWLDRAEIREISDPIGPADTDGDLEAIVITEETISGAEKINQLRSRKGLNELEVVEIPLVIADDGEPISSARIRAGEIDPHGNLK